MAHAPADSGAPLLEARGLTKVFGGLAAVRDVDFAVRRGELVSVIGPNGAGKTTLFNLISGFYPATRGEVRFQDRSLNGLKPYQRARLGIGRTFQIVKPFPGLSVLENVMVGAFSHTANVKQATAEAMDTLEFVGLAARARVMASSLTLAGRKRLEVARSLATRPQIILLDEVSAGLNPTEIEDMIALLRRLPDRGVSAVAGVEHVMKVVMALSHRIIVLNHGQKIAEGTPAEVSANRVVIEAYLGSEVTPHAS